MGFGQTGFERRETDLIYLYQMYFSLAPVDVEHDLAPKAIATALIHVAKELSLHHCPPGFFEACADDVLRGGIGVHADNRRDPPNSAYGNR